MGIREDCRAWRVSRGISQTEIARRAGVDQSTVSRWEEGRARNDRVLSVYVQMGVELSPDDLMDYILQERR